MKHTRLLIMAGGKEERWRNHLGTHKHLVSIHGERLLDRTVRMLRERGAADIMIVAKYPEYDVACTQRVHPHDEHRGAVVSSRDFWSGTQRTTVVFGDVYFTDAAMDRICNMSSPQCTFIGRSRRSRITGCPYQELFGLSLVPESHRRVSQSIERVKQALADGEIRICPGWSIYRHLQGLHLRDKRCPANFLNIDDFTEDFDVPEDYERWIQRFETRDEAKPSRWQFWKRAA